MSQIGFISGCDGDYEHGASYSSNRDSKPNTIQCLGTINTPEQCQDFCKTFADCALWEWGTCDAKCQGMCRVLTGCGGWERGPRCCAMKKQSRRISLVPEIGRGRVAGARNASRDRHCSVTWPPWGQPYKECGLPPLGIKGHSNIGKGC